MFAAEALDPTVVQGGALGIVALVVWWFIRSSDRNYNDDRTDRDRLAGDKAALEQKLQAANEEIIEQRRLKHEAIGRYAAAAGTLSLIRKTVDTCNCGAMTPMGPLLDAVLEERS
jgi:hypothetical protein